MVLLMFLAFGVASSSRVVVQWRIASAIAFVAMGAGIAVSGSRGPVVYLMLAAAVALALIPGARPRIATLLKALGMVGVAALLAVFLIGSVIGERFATIFDPQAFLWKWFDPLTYGLKVAQEHPFGMGLGYTAGVPQFINNPAFRGLPTTNVDSGYGSAAAELGLLGLLLFTYFAVKVGIEGVRAWKRLPPGRLRDLLLGPALVAATYPIVSLIGQPQATLPSSVYCWLLIGMLLKAPELQRALDADQLLRSQVHAGE
jgi:O-antigen ligase